MLPEPAARGRPAAAVVAGTRGYHRPMGVGGEPGPGSKAPSSGPGRVVLVAAGSACVGIGAIGVFVPGVPTTPFLLLAAVCFTRSSPRLHGWLLSHRRLGPYVSGFLEGGGLTVRAKRASVLGLWATITLSTALVFLRQGVTSVSVGTAAVLLLVAVLVSRYILRRPTIPDRPGT